MTQNLIFSIIFVSIMIKYSSQYIEMTAEDHTLCSVTNRKRKIKLEEGFRSGLIMKQSRIGDHFIDWERNFRCKFQVSADSHREGVIAVIQHLVFRKNSTTDECIDYVQFTKKDGSSSQKFCGRFNAALYMDHNFVDPNARIASGTAIVDERGELDVFIFVAKDRLNNYEELDFSIVFTAYRHCSQVLRKDPSFRPCSRERREFCIFSGFFYDNYINCPSPECEDEEGCTKTIIIDDTKYGNKVIVGALSGVTVIFAIFILCLWVCKTFKILCWSQTFANPSTPTPQNTEEPRELEEQIEIAPTPSTANANQGEGDKDLPPSYDSLFPQR